MTEEWIGYGDPECASCKLVKNSAYLKLCRAMVGYTELEVEAARNYNLTQAAVYEGRQNDIAVILNTIEIDGEVGLCKPGFDRI